VSCRVLTRYRDDYIASAGVDAGDVGIVEHSVHPIGVHCRTTSGAPEPVLRIIEIEYQEPNFT